MHVLGEMWDMKISDEEGGASHLKVPMMNGETLCPLLATMLCPEVGRWIRVKKGKRQL
jgi:hypothetical protein